MYVCVHVCMCVCACMCVRVYERINVSVHLCTNACVHVCMSACVCMGVCVSELPWRVGRKGTLSSWICDQPVAAGNTDSMWGRLKIIKQLGGHQARSVHAVVVAWECATIQRIRLPFFEKGVWGVCRLPTQNLLPTVHVANGILVPTRFVISMIIILKIRTRSACFQVLKPDVVLFV